MKSIHNPFEVLSQQMSEIKDMLIEIRDQPKEDYSTKYYTRKEVAEIIRRSIQTIDNYIERGMIKVEMVGERGKLIHHYEIFNKDNSLKELTYKRKA